MEERLVCWSPFSYAEITCTLQGLHGFHQHRLASGRTQTEKGIERAHSLRTDLAVDDDVGIVALFGVECVQRSLEQCDGDLWAHIDASIEQFGGDVRREFLYGREAGMPPQEGRGDCLGLFSRALP